MPNKIGIKPINELAINMEATSIGLGEEGKFPIYDFGDPNDLFKKYRDHLDDLNSWVYLSRYKVVIVQKDTQCSGTKFNLWPYGHEEGEAYVPQKPTNRDLYGVLSQLHFMDFADELFEDSDPSRTYLHVEGDLEELWEIIKLSEDDPEKRAINEVQHIFRFIMAACEICAHADIKSIPKLEQFKRGNPQLYKTFIISSWG